jgi:hypothetical protein
MVEGGGEGAEQEEQEPQEEEEQGNPAVVAGRVDPADSFSLRW